MKKEKEETKEISDVRVILIMMRHLRLVSPPSMMKVSALQEENSMEKEKKETTNREEEIIIILTLDMPCTNRSCGLPPREFYRQQREEHKEQMRMKRDTSQVILVRVFIRRIVIH